MGSESPIAFQWLGVAGIELRYDDYILAIDPFFTRPPFWNLAFGRPRPDEGLVAAHLPRCDGILVTHTHYDHLMDVPAAARLTGARVWGSPNTCQVLATTGVPREQATEIHPGEHFEAGPFAITVTGGEHTHLPAIHPGPVQKDLRPPLRLRDYQLDMVLNFEIKAGGRTLLDWASESIDGACPAQVLFCGAFRDPAVLTALLAAVRPALVIPAHWDDFFRPLSKPTRPTLLPPRLRFPPVARLDMQSFTRAVKMGCPGCRVLIPERFKEYQVEEFSHR